MKYVILIYANPQPWGHPVENYLPEYADMSPEERQRHTDEFETLLGELHDNGELQGGQAFGDPDASQIYRWDSHGVTTGDGPYAETKEHLAGFFVIDVGDRARAEHIGARFGGPGLTVDLRPLAGGDED